MSKPKGKARAKANRKAKNKQKNDYFVRKKYLIESIRKYDDFVLYEESKEVPHGEDVKGTFKKMRQVLNATKNGVGLASNQIGITKKMVIIKPDSDSDDITYMINPVIESTSKKKKYGKEMCLSYPGVSGMIEKYTSVEVSYYDQDWKKHTVEYGEGNFLGIIFQHEFEHISLKGHCQVWEWWKDPEGKQKELEEKFKPEEEQNSNNDVVESEDLKKEKEEISLNDIELFPFQEEALKVIEEDAQKEPNEETKEAIEQLEAGEGDHFDTVDEFFEKM